MVELQLGVPQVCYETGNDAQADANVIALTGGRKRLGTMAWKGESS